jgi:hypothetical protein
VSVDSVLNSQDDDSMPMCHSNSHESYDDDSMPMCHSNSHESYDDGIMIMCLLNSQDDDSMPMCHYEFAVLNKGACVRAVLKGHACEPC